MPTTYTMVAGGGDWNTNATWGGAGHPVAGDTAIIDGAVGNGNITVGTVAACAVLTFKNGYTGTFTLNAGITTTGNITLLSTMTFTPNAQTWTIGGSCTFDSGGLTLGAISTAGTGGGGPYTITLSRDTVMSGLLTVSGSGNGIALASHNLSVGGGITLGTASATITGQTITVTGGAVTGGGGTTAYMTSNLIFAGNVTVSGNFYYKTGTITYSSGSVTTTGSTLYLAGSTTLNTTNGANYITWNNVLGSATGTWTLTSDLHTGAFNISNAAATITMSGTYNVYVSGNWSTGGSSHGVYTKGTETVIFNGTTTVLATTTFNNVTILQNASVTFTSAASLNPTYTVAGTFSALGTPCNHITVGATTTNKANLAITGTVGVVAYVDASYINASSKAVACIGGSVANSTAWTESGGVRCGNAAIIQSLI